MEPQRCYIWRWLVLSILELCAHIFEYYLHVHSVLPSKGMKFMGTCKSPSKSSMERSVALTAAITCLKLQYLRKDLTHTHTHSVCTNTEFKEHAQCQICNWLFNVGLMRSIMFLYTWTNLPLNVKPCCYHPTSFFHIKPFSGSPALFLIHIRPSFSVVLYWDTTQKCHTAEPE